LSAPMMCYAPIALQLLDFANLNDLLELINKNNHFRL